MNIIYTETHHRVETQVKGVYVIRAIRHRTGEEPREEFVGVELPADTLYVPTAGHRVNIARKGQMHFFAMIFLIGGKVYHNNNGCIKTAGRSRSRTVLENYERITRDNLPKFFERMQAAKARVTLTYDKRTTLLLYKGKYMNLGCSEAFEILRGAGLIKKDGSFTKKTKLRNDVIAERFGYVDRILKEFAQMEAENV